MEYSSLPIICIYQEVETAVGPNSNWTHYHCLLSGVKKSGEDTTSMDARAKLALHLYRETVSLLLPTLSEERRSVVERELILIEKRPLMTHRAPL